jgi:hypothetical protein
MPSATTQAKGRSSAFSKTLAASSVSCETQKPTAMQSSLFERTAPLWVMPAA